jgi:hypothetical protein
VSRELALISEDSTNSKPRGSRNFLDVGLGDVTGILHDLHASPGLGTVFNNAEDTSGLSAA